MLRLHSGAWPAERRGSFRGQSNAGKAQPAGPAGNLRQPRNLRGGPGTGQKNPKRGGVQPFQKNLEWSQSVGCGGAEGQHTVDWPYRLRQDAAGRDTGPHPGSALCRLRRHLPHRVGICWRRRGEHPAAADSGRRLGLVPGGKGHRLHRRTGQDRPERRRQPLHNPGCIRRGCSTGVAQDYRGMCRQRAAPRGKETPPPGVHPDQHPQYFIYMRWSLRGD